jgi:uncharacterized protein (TIGR00299 family) protein
MKSDNLPRHNTPGQALPSAHQAGKVLFIEPFSGISGDMFLGALLDLGLDLARIEEKLRVLPLTGYALSLSRCSRAGIHAARFEVQCEAHEAHGHAHHHEAHGHDPHHAGHGHAHRSFREIRALIESSGLSAWARGKSVETFHKLAVAEGKIHGQHPDDVHFHEVGAIDSIVDIVGAAVAIEELLPVRLISTAVNVGHGSLECRHGVYPAPGPAAIELLKGIPIYSTAVSGELTTPTGAALLAAVVDDFGPRPLMRVERIGYGAGGRDIKGAANVLRVTLGEVVPSGCSDATGDQVAVIEATVDDMNPQMYGYFLDKALALGALDVFAVPAHMKKNRPGINLVVVCAPDQIDAMAAQIFAETTTIGIRYTLARRKTLDRELVEVQTEYGGTTIKVSFLNGRRVNFAPEYECCCRLAMEKGVALKEVMAAASRAYLELNKKL